MLENGLAARSRRRLSRMTVHDFTFAAKVQRSDDKGQLVDLAEGKMRFDDFLLISG